MKISRLNALLGLLLLLTSYYYYYLASLIIFFLLFSGNTEFDDFVGLYPFIIIIIIIKFFIKS